MDPIVFWTVVAAVGAVLIAVGFLVGRLATAGPGAGIPWRAFGQSALSLIALAIVAAGVYALMASGLIASIPPQGGWAVAFLIFAVAFAVLAICARWWWGAPVGLQGLLIGASIACFVCWFSSRLTPSFGWVSGLPPQWTVGITEVMLFLGITAYITGKWKTTDHYLHPPAAGTLFIDWWTRTRIAGMMLTFAGVALWFLRDFTLDLNAPLAIVNTINRWRHGTIANEDWLLLFAIGSALLAIWGFMAPVQMRSVAPPAGSPAGTAPIIVQLKSWRKLSARWAFAPLTIAFLILWFAAPNTIGSVGLGGVLPPLSKYCTNAQNLFALAPTLFVLAAGLLAMYAVSKRTGGKLAVVFVFLLMVGFSGVSWGTFSSSDCNMGKAVNGFFGPIGQTLEKLSDGFAALLKSAAAASSTPSPATSTPPPAPTAPRGPVMMPATNATTQLIQCDGVERIYPLNAGQRLDNRMARDMRGNPAACGIQIDSRTATMQLTLDDGSRPLIRPADPDNMYNGVINQIQVLVSGNVYVFACPYPQSATARGVCR